MIHICERDVEDLVTDDRQAAAERIAPGFGLTPEDALRSPHALVGTIGQVVDDLQQTRDEYGFSYVVFSGDVFDIMAPVVEKLAGTQLRASGPSPPGRVWRLLHDRAGVQSIDPGGFA